MRADVIIEAFLITGATIPHTKTLDIYFVPDILRYGCRELLALLEALLYAFGKFFRNDSILRFKVLLCSLMAKIVRLALCKNDLWICFQKGHNIVNIIPELFLEGNR